MSISNQFPLENPTLNLDFAKSKKLDSRVQFTKSTSATAAKTSFVNSDGVINYNVFNMPRFDHSVREIKNLYLHSENTSLWSAGFLSQRNPTAITAPDGSLTGNLVVEDTNTDQHLVFQDIGTITQGANYTFSIYAKQYTANRNLSLTFHGGGYAIFNLGSGRILANGGYTARIEDVGNGWYRCSISGGFTSTTGRAYAILHNGTTHVYTGDNASGVYLWGGQFEIGTTPSEYVKTTFSNDSVYNVTPKGLILEETRTNLITMSGRSDMGNFFLQDAYVKRNSELAPDNTYSADKLFATTTGGSNTCYVQKWEPITANNKTYVFSVFLKPGTSPRVTLNMQLSGGTYQQSVVTVDWETKSIVSDTGSNGTITPYGNGWYRVSTALTNNGTNTTIYPRVYVRDQGTANVRGHTVFIWGWQVETVSYGNDVPSTFTTSYLPSLETFTSRSTTATKFGQGFNITTSAVNTARYDFFPNGEYANFLLLEPASTNLLSYTESFGNWTAANGTTVSSNVAGINAPDGSITADKLIEAPATAGSVQQIIFYSRSGSNETVTFSIFVRRAERSSVLLQMSNFLNETAQAIYDLTLGTATLEFGLNGGDYVNASAEIIPYPNEWFRCILTARKNAVNTINNVSVTLRNSSNQQVYTGNGTSGVYLWGAQLETGTSATSYIPATGASNVTRAADIYSTATVTKSPDNLKISNIDTSSWFNNRTAFGTIYMEYDDVKKIGTGGSYTRLIELTGSAGDVVRIAIIPNSLSTYLEFYIDGAYRNTFASTNLSSGKNKIVMVYMNGQFYWVLNGVLVSRQVISPSILNKFNTLYIGSDSGGGSISNGTISKFTYYPYTISLQHALQLTK